MFSAGIPLSWVERQTLGAVAEGMSRDALYADTLIERRFGDDRDQVTPAQLTLLYMNICTAIEDEAHGLGGSRIKLGQAELAVRAMLGCSTLEMAISAMLRLYRLMSSAVRLELRTEGDEAVLAVSCDEGSTRALPCFLEDCYLSFTFMCLSHFAGRPLPLNMLETRDAMHVNLWGRHWATRSPVRLASVSALRMPLSVLRLPRGTEGGERTYPDLLLSWVDFVERDLTPSGLAGVDAGLITVGEFARDAGVSSATMRRRMNREHGGFRQARKVALVSAGLKLLRSDQESVDAIAARLGYSDARSFRRFIKNATGRTPEELRAGQDIDALYMPNAAVKQRIDAKAKLMSV
jgi:AraC-like DNA-binding protein